MSTITAFRKCEACLETHDCTAYDKQWLCNECREYFEAENEMRDEELRQMAEYEEAGK